VPTAQVAPEVQAEQLTERRAAHCSAQLAAQQLCFNEKISLPRQEEQKSRTWHEN